MSHKRGGGWKGVCPIRGGGGWKGVCLIRGGGLEGSMSHKRGGGGRDQIVKHCSQRHTIVRPCLLWFQLLWQQLVRIIQPWVLFHVVSWAPTRVDWVHLVS